MCVTRGEGVPANLLLLAAISPKLINGILRPLRQPALSAACLPQRNGIDPPPAKYRRDRASRAARRTLWTSLGCIMEAEVLRVKVESDSSAIGSSRNQGEVACLLLFGNLDGRLSPWLRSWGVLTDGFRRVMCSQTDVSGGECLCGKRSTDQ